MSKNISSAIVCVNYFVCTFCYCVEMTMCCSDAEYLTNSHTSQAVIDDIITQVN